MNSENQIWSLIWSSLQEVSLQGSQRQEAPSGTDQILSEALEQGEVYRWLILAMAASVHHVKKEKKTLQ